MSKFTRKLNKLYGSHTLEGILSSNLDEPKKEEPAEKPAEKPAEQTASESILAMA